MDNSNWTLWNEEMRQLIISHRGEGEAKEIFNNGKVYEYINQLYNQGLSVDDAFQKLLRFSPDDSDKFYIA